MGVRLPVVSTHEVLRCPFVRCCSSLCSNGRLLSGGSLGAVRSLTGVNGVEGPAVLLGKFFERPKFQGLRVSRREALLTRTLEVVEAKPANTKAPHSGAFFM